MGNPKKVPDPSADPVNPQPNAARNGNADPVYGQSQDTPTAQSGPAHMKPATGDAIGQDDAVYPQPQRNANWKEHSQNDPVYGQSTQPSPSSSGPQPSKASGDPIGTDDPVYPQGQQSKVSKQSDPVYGQSTQAPPPAQGPQPTKASGNPITRDDPVYPQPNSAASRLNQLTSQIAPTPTESYPANTKKSRRKAKAAEHELPADYSDILGHLATMRKMTETPDTSSRGYQRQKTSGKLWARERIAQLLDPDTWHELGAASGITEWRLDEHNPQAEHVESFTPLNNPQGFGVMTDPVTGMKRKIYLTADDFSIRAGHADGGNSQKTKYGEKMALKLKLPVVKMCDGSSGGGSVSTIAKTGWSYVPDNTYLSTAALQLNAGIPNLGMVLGPAIGLGAARVVCTHFSVMAGDIGSLFNAGPKVVEGATFEEDLSFQDLGGPGVHCRNGTIDNLAANEAECFEQVKTVLGYLPDYGGQPPPCVPCSDPITREDINLRSVIPRKKGRAYNPWSIILSVVDKGSWFEIGKLWGGTAIVGLARLGGRPVGVMSNNCEQNSGALDPAGSQKMMKHLKFCDVFNLPILQFIDVRKYFLFPHTIYMLY
jgi:acetyl-CoA carboxylase carboxyltransferase component